MIKKIVILGPESTGKSTLCAQLAQHYQMQWCPEFAREYLLTNGKTYQYADLLNIAHGQIALEDEYYSMLHNAWKCAEGKGWVNQQSLISSKYPPTLFIDTDMYVMKVWSEYVFGKCDPFILNQIVTRKYDLYLLCNIDLPWVKDALREYPEANTRNELFHIYKDLLINQQQPWIEISGNNEARIAAAIEAVNGFYLAEG